MKIGFDIYIKISSVLNKVLWKKTKIFLSQLKKILTTKVNLKNKKSVHETNFLLYMYLYLNIM